jgi:signal transduction histidine kinase
MTPDSGAQVRVLDVFVDVLGQVDAHDGAEEFYARLAEAICRLTSMERAAIFRYDADERRVRLAGAHDLPVDRFLGLFVTVEDAPFARRALEEDRVIELTHDIERELPEGFASVLIPGRHLVCVPMAAAGRWVGVVVADREGETDVSEEERDLLWTLGKTAALAASARLVTSEMEKTEALEQRIDMAREIHDSVIQRLFGVSLALSSGGDGAWDAADRERAAAEVQAALRDLRIAVQRPLGRATRETGTTLTAEIDRLASTHPDLGLRLQDGDPDAVPAALQPITQSILVEAVRNARKHATPSSVLVRLARVDGTFVLTIGNDGVGSRESRGTGMGLRLAAIEAIQLGGILEFGAPTPGWWQVKLMVPDG